MQPLPNNLVEQISDAYKSCSNTERQYLKLILEELADYGDSPTYRDIWLADYKEIPVSIDTFLDDDAFLGKVTRNGTAIYPTWRKAMRDVFNAGNQFHEIVLTGATRIGKTSTAITMTAYMLYRLMCLKNPQEFFHKKDVSKFSITFFNITKDLAKGVAYREFNDTLRESPWFCGHGKFSKSERNFYYIPDGDKIIIDYGSDASHGLGQQIFVGFMDECLTGDTLIHTDKGVLPIQSIAGEVVNVLQYDTENDSYYHVKSLVQLTKYVNDIICIELEDGTVIKGTSDHKIMMSDGTYKELQHITEQDDILVI